MVEENLANQFASLTSIKKFAAILLKFLYQASSKQGFQGPVLILLKPAVTPK